MIEGVGEAYAIDMSTGFDPYRAWLGVHEVRRPLNAYELLGLSSLEDDPELIRASVGLKRAALLSRRDEAPAEVWDQLYCEIEEAARVLLDPERKTAYDLAVQMPPDPRTANRAQSGLSDHNQGAVLTCGLCQTANPATRRFCKKCGEPLWEPCVHCGTICVSGERFCGACGANLEANLRRQSEQFEQDFQRAKLLQEQWRFDDALKLLKSIAKADHPRLSSVIVRANQTIEELAAGREQSEQLADARLQEAEHALASQDVRGAIGILESIPSPLRTPAMTQRLDELAQRDNEAGLLRREVEQAVAAREFGGLLPKIARLLDLKSDDTSAIKLAAALQERLCAKAKKLLAACQYQAALDIIGEIPAAIRLPATEALSAEIAEVAWMVRDLCQSPVADATLAAIAERLRAAAPHDAKTAKLCDEVKRRVNHAAKTVRLTDVPWSTPPSETPLGFPVEGVAGFRAMSFPDEFDMSSLQANPGSFYVAAGLALQGIEAAAVNINLLPAEDRGMLKAISKVMRIRIDGSAKTAWGLDLGAGGLKAIRLSWNEREEKAVVHDVIYRAHRKPLSEAANLIEADALIDETLQRFVERTELKADRVCIGVPSSLTLTRQWKLPPADPAKIDALVRHEIPHQVPFKLDALAWDYHLFESDNGPVDAADAPSAKKRGLFRRERAELKENSVLLVVVKHELIQKRLERFDQLGIHPDVAQCDAIALANWFRSEHRAKRPTENHDASKPEKATAILDIGSDAAKVVVVSPRTVWYRNMGVSGRSFTRAIVQGFQLTLVEAERWKRTPESAPSLSRLYAALDPLFDELGRELRSSLEQFMTTQPAYCIDRVLVLGGGSRLHGLLRHLQRGV